MAQTPTTISITPPKINTMAVTIIGTAPYCQARFSEKAKNMMMDKMAEGSTAKGKKIRDARDFDADCEAAMHISTDGWIGIPAASFRAACISACRLVGYKMTIAKMSVFIEAEGFDRVDGIPLVKIHGDWERLDMHTRNATGVIDIRVRPMWRFWSANLRVQYDADQFRERDVANLLMRAGMQVGVGEGRPDSKNSAGIGFGTFRLKEGNE